MTVARTLLTTAAAAALATGALLTGAGSALAADEPAVTATESAVAESTEAPTPEAAPADAPVQKAAVVPKAATVFGTLKASPAGPYTDGQTVTLTYTGFPANAQIVASTCVGGITLGGPGDCAPLNGSGSAITAADGSGKGSVKIKVIAGTLGASDEPSHKCGNTSSQKCVFSVTDFSGNGPKTIAVKYKTAAASTGASTGSSTGSSSGADTGSSSSSSTDSSTSATSNTGGTASGTAGSNDPALATTGSSTSTVALGGLGMVAVGALFVVAFSRRFSTEHARD